MKNTILLLIALVLAGLLHAQDQLSKTQQTVQQTIISMFDALSNRDSISLKTFCTADIALFEYGQLWNIDTLILKAITLNQATDFKRSNSFDFINTRADKNTAWVAYHLNSVITREGKQATAQWLETVVLVKEGKQWKIRHLHSTLIKRS
jgi:ketosteroid isomerase-like protein